MSDFEKLRAETLTLEKKIEQETKKALDEIEKKYGKERDKKRKELQSGCSHEFVIEARGLDDDYHAQCNCWYQPDPYRHSKAYFRACCVCGLTESSKGTIGSGVFEKLAGEPVACYYEALAVDSAARQFMSLSLSELRKEAVRLHKEKKGGE